MTNLKHIAAAAIAAIAVGAAAATPAHALKATTTGNQQQDEYCRGVADLINDALANRDRYDASHPEWAEWNDLAREFQARGTANGCSFAIKAKRPVKHRAPAATATKKRG